MLIGNYTNTDSVRSLIGIESFEAPDSLIENMHMEIDLESELDEWLPTHAAIYAAGIAATPTADESKQWKLLQIYSQYYCAWLLSHSELTVLSRREDGNFRFWRIASSLESLQEYLRRRADDFRDKLELIVDGASSSATVGILSISSPSYDPVTHEDS